MASLEDLYQDIILEHNKRPRNYGPLKDATHQADGDNPLCGDELKVSLRFQDGVVQAVHFQGQGCAISKASASLMTEVLAGLPGKRAKTLVENVLQALKSPADQLSLDEHGDLAALSGVKKFPARIKCATLAWHAFLAALEGEKSVSTEVGEHS
jgi:nitrogen fixation NifU-like protein